MPGAAPQVLIVLVNWNGWRDTVECLESCAALDHPSYGIVVVDNGSTDGSAGEIRARDNSVRVIETGANLGFAAGNNVGIRLALEEGAEFVWLLNNDTTVDPHALSALVDGARTDAGIAVAGSKIRYADPPDTLWFAGGCFVPRRGWTAHRGMGEVDRGQYDQAGPVDYITGASMLVRCEAIRQVGEMDEGYFMYWEEVDWCARMRAAGWKIRFEPASLVWHKVGASIGTGESPVRARYEARNRIRYYRRNDRARLPLVTLTTAGQAVWALLLGKPAIARATAAGLLDAARGRTGAIGG